MTVYAQCGSRRGGVTGAILADGLRNRHIGGAILSPANEDPASLDALIADCKAAGTSADLLIDPQVYVATMSGVRDTKLTTHDWFPKKTLKPASFTLRETPRIVGAALDWQYQRGVTTIVSPTVPITALDREPFSQISYMMAEEACAHHAESGDARPLLISILVREDALQRTEPVREFFDRLRALEPAPAGFYIIVERLNPGYTQAFEERALSNLLWCCHVLGNLDGMRVIVGYADMVGLLLQAAGAEATACGWHQNLRYFHRQRWMPSTGGGVPRKRFTSLPLFDSLLINPELLALGMAGLFKEVRSGTLYDAKLPEEVGWTPTTSTWHHWASITEGAKQIQAAKSPIARLDLFEESIRHGLLLGKQIERKSIPFEQRMPASHLENWGHALKMFRNAVKI